MKIANTRLLDAFARVHSDAAGALRAWRRDVKAAQWKHSADLKARYPKASVIDSKWAVFNICGNRYRLAVKVDYSIGVVLVKKIGTHAEYDKWQYD